MLVGGWKLVAIFYFFPTYDGPVAGALLVAKTEQQADKANLNSEISSRNAYYLFSKSQQIELQFVPRMLGEYPRHNNV